MLHGGKDISVCAHQLLEDIVQPADLARTLTDEGYILLEGVLGIVLRLF